MREHLSGAQSYMQEVLTPAQRFMFAEDLWLALASGTGAERLALKRKIFDFFEVYLG